MTTKEKHMRKDMFVQFERALAIKKTLSCTFRRPAIYQDTLVTLVSSKGINVDLSSKRRDIKKSITVGCDETLCSRSETTSATNRIDEGNNNADTNLDVLFLDQETSNGV